MDILSLPETLRRQATNELDGGERVRWVAQPRPRRRFPVVAIFPVLFAIPWTLFAVFWTAAAAGVLDGFLGAGGGGAGGETEPEPARLLFAAAGIPFILIGLAMLSTPYWLTRRLRRAAARTAYVITDHRAIIFDGGYYGDGAMMSLIGGMMMRARGETNIKSYGPEDLTSIERVERADGSGDVLFDVLSAPAQRHGHAQSLRVGFFSVHDAKDVSDRLEELADAGRRG